MTSRSQTGTNQQGKHVLLVDDDVMLSDLLKDYLIKEGYRVSVAHNGNGMRRVIDQSPVDIALVDLMLPQEDGLVLAHSLRAESLDIGIIILTGRGDTVERIIGLEMGADDYVVKPVDLRELLARIRAVGRRLRPPSQPADEHSRLRFSGWLLDTLKRELFSPTGEHVQLTAGEFDLLVALVSHPNRLLSRDQLLDTRGRNASPFDRAIDVQIGRLRRKLNENSKEPRLIKTVRGVGYMFTAPVELVTKGADVSPGNSQPRDLRSPDRG